MYFGCAWYPEHWDQSRWQEDLGLMRDAGMNVVRVGEFAWSTLEPREGQFNLDWLERAVEMAARVGIRTVIGTPTAAPPAWLTARYPQVLRVNPDGTVATHGGRCHFNPASLTYQRLCRRIVEALARRFGSNPHVIGWQIDNEYHVFSYDQWTRRRFQQFLKDRYGTLDNLNRRWTTAYWSQTYTDWSQIPLAPAGQNPCLLMEFRRFFSHVYREYQRNQIEVIRRWSRSQFITHNFHGRFEAGDPRELAEDLDLASWDPYVGSGHLDHDSMGMMHDLVRGFKRRNFWVMETQPGTVNWAGVNNALDRGEVRCMAWHLIGHGADAVLYWQWRSALGGQEQYHGTIVDPSGSPRPLYEEIRRTGVEIRKLGDLLGGTHPRPRVAILLSFADRWAIDCQRHHRDFDPLAHAGAFYRALRRLGHDVDVIDPRADLNQYPLVIAPHLHMLDDALARHLGCYVERGGHLVLGARSGMKDPFNALLPSRQPGLLAPLLGASVEEYYALERPIAVCGSLGRGTATIWAESLRPESDDASTLLTYGPHSWLEGRPAMVSRSIGRGRTTYIGAWFDDALMRDVVRWLTQTADVPPVLEDLPRGVEVCRRVGPDQALLVLINHTAEPRALTLPGVMFDHLGDVAVGPVITMEARQVMVLSPA